jgi:hypothetical protein
MAFLAPSNGPLVLTSDGRWHGESEVQALPHFLAAAAAAAALSGWHGSPLLCWLVCAAEVFFWAFAVGLHWLGCTEILVHDGTAIALLASLRPTCSSPS